MQDSQDLTAAIDSDEGLKYKRKLLIITSLTLLALSFSGAKIEEANTFIFKINFAHQNGLAILLVLSIMFLTIRYYNYAYKYHKLIYSIWTKRMLQHWYFDRGENLENRHGLLTELIPYATGLEDFGMDGEKVAYTNEYYASFPFVKNVGYSWEKNEEKFHASVNLLKACSMGNYLKILKLEAQFQSKSFLNHREALDILAPYFISCSAIASYFFNTKLQVLLNFISLSSK